MYLPPAIGNNSIEQLGPCFSYIFTDNQIEKALLSQGVNFHLGTTALLCYIVQLAFHEAWASILSLSSCN